MKTPTVDYPLFFGRLTGIIASYEIGVLSRKEFLDKAHAVEAEYRTLAEACWRHHSQGFDAAIKDAP